MRSAASPRSSRPTWSAGRGFVEADEPGTIARQRAHRAELIDPAIARHHGRIVKTTGDGLLAEFASVADAVECAVAIQRGMAEREGAVAEARRVRYRVGINLGDVVLDGDDILGDGVNVAARLEGLAEPGGICLSGTVYDLVRNKVALHYDDVGRHSVKNVKEPLHVYRVVLDEGAQHGDRASLERIYRERLKARFSEDAAFYVPLVGETSEPASGMATKAPRSARRRAQRADFEYHEWVRSGQDIKRVRIESIAEAVAKYPCIVLVGEPGCGKTTALEHIAYELADAPETLPIPLSLGGLEPGMALDDFVVRGLLGLLGPGQATAPELAAYLHGRLAGGEVFLLLDGLNEMPLAGRRKRLLELRSYIERWAAHGNRFLVTCRLLDHGEELAGPQRVEVQPLSEDGIRQFLQNELPGEWQELWQALVVSGDRAHRLLDLARNPYFLTVMIDVFEEDGTLGRSRAGLMRRFTHILLDWAKARCPPGAWLSAEVQHAALAVLAYEMQARADFGTRVRTGLVKAVMPPEVQPDPRWPAQPAPPDRVLDLAAGANIVDLPADRSTVRFHHQLLQEYFAAQQMLRRDPAGLAELWRWPWLEAEMPRWQRPENNHEPLPPPPTTGWEETTILAAGLAPDGDDRLIRALIEVNPVLAARCLLQASELLAAAHRRAVVERLLRTIGDAEVALRVRIAAGDALGRLGDPRLGEMVLIPAGCFLMGEGRERHDVRLPAYRIGKYPLTNAEYGQLVAAGGYRERRWWTAAGWSEVAAAQSEPRYWRDARFNAPNQPVIGLSWYECVAYCRWLSAETGRPHRLPSEAEWEKAARGVDGCLYPWGDAFDASRLNGQSKGQQVCSSTPVGIYPSGASPFGLLDCVGNVWEWCATRWRKTFPYDADEDEWRADYLEGRNLRVLRGGSWYHPAEATSCVHRFRFEPYGWNDRGGCRLVTPA